MDTGGVCLLYLEMDTGFMFITNWGGYWVYFIEIADVLYAAKHLETMNIISRPNLKRRGTI